MITLRLILRLHLPAMKTVEFWGKGADVEKVAASGHLVPRRNLGRRKILCLITVFVAKITAEGLGEGLAEG